MSFIKKFNNYKKDVKSINEENEESKNYMTIQNLKNIISNSQEMLNILTNDKELDEWAKDHIATSKDDIEEVFNFLKYK